MENFKYNTKTTLYSGRGCIRQNADVIKGYGSKAIIFTTHFPEGSRNLGLEDLKFVFEENNIDYLVYDDVEVDPPVEKCAELAARAKDFHADFFVGLGGGSSIDTAKAVSLLLTYPDNDNPYDVFYAMGAPSKSNDTESAIPVIAVPTTAGSGSEVSGFSVLTRADTNTKLCMYPLVFPVLAFLDGDYLKEAPADIIHTGVIDALAHGVETYLHVGSNPMNRAMARYGFELFADFKNRMNDGNYEEDDYDKMLLAAYVQGCAFMQSSTTIPHGMGYPLSHVKHVCHGLANGIFLGEYVRGFHDQSLVQPIVEMCGFKNSDEFAEFCKSITEDDIVGLEVSEEEIQNWTDDFMKLDFRLAANPEVLDRNDIENLYRKSLQKFIK